jgi:hypothetical protein
MQVWEKLKVLMSILGLGLHSLSHSAKPCFVFASAIKFLYLSTSLFYFYSNTAGQTGNFTQQHFMLNRFGGKTK